MAANIAKVIEVTASSSKGIEDAVQSGLKKVAKTVKGIKGAWVSDIKVVTSEDGKVVEWRHLRISFVVEDLPIGDVDPAVRMVVGGFFIPAVAYCCGRPQQFALRAAWGDKDRNGKRSGSSGLLEDDDRAELYRAWLEQAGFWCAPMRGQGLRRRLGAESIDLLLLD
jgi:hypothetical protein